MRGKVAGIEETEWFDAFYLCEDDEGNYYVLKYTYKREVKVGKLTPEKAREAYAWAGKKIRPPTDTGKPFLRAVKKDETCLVAQQ